MQPTLSQIRLPGRVQLEFAQQGRPGEARACYAAARATR